MKYQYLYVTLKYKENLNSIKVTGGVLMISNVLMGLQILLGIVLTIVIMPQESKTAMPSQYGGEGNQSYFKPKGKQAFLNKVTKVISVLFFLNAIALLILSK